MRKILVRNGAGKTLARLTVRVSSDGHREYRDSRGRVALAFFEHGKWWARVNTASDGTYRAFDQHGNSMGRQEFASEFKAFSSLIPSRA